MKRSILLLTFLLCPILAQAHGLLVAAEDITVVRGTEATSMFQASTPIQTSELRCYLRHSIVNYQDRTISEKSKFEIVSFEQLSGPLADDEIFVELTSFPFSYLNPRIVDLRTKFQQKKITRAQLVKELEEKGNIIYREGATFKINFLLKSRQTSASYHMLCLSPKRFSFGDVMEKLFHEGRLKPSPEM